MLEHHRELLAEYERTLPALRERGEILCGEIAAWLAPDVKAHSVTVRFKTSASLAQKLARPDKSYRSLWEVTDLVGIRVITYFEDAVDAVGKILEARLPVALEHSIDKRRRLAAGTFGYRSLHYVCRLDARAHCEVQVRTVLEHAWAEIEHDLGYKSSGAVPADARRRLMRLAGLLELADQEFVAIRESLTRYARSLPDRVATEAVPLDRVSLDFVLAIAEVRALDCAIAHALGQSLGAAPFFPDYLLRMLHSTGIRTVADARCGVTRHAGAIEAMVAPYFAFARQAWNLSPEPVRGYALFFLAHAMVLTSSSLRLEKVERLAELYRELDYPDDAREAQRVAGLLVDALAEVD